MSIRARLLALSGFFIFALILVSYVAYSGSSRLSSSLDNVSLNRLPSVRMVTLVDMAHDGLRSVVYHAMYDMYKNAEAAEEIREEVKDFQKMITENIDGLQKLDLSVQAKQDLVKASLNVREYATKAETVVEFALSGRRERAEEELEQFLISFENLEAQLKVIGEEIIVEANQIQSQGKGTPGFVLIICLLSISLGLVASIVIVISTNKTLLKMFVQIEDSVHKLDGESKALAETSLQLAKSNQEQASSVAETSSSLEQISGMVSANLGVSRESADHTAKVSELVKSGVNSMSRLQDSVDQIAQSGRRIETLSKMIEEIGAKTKLIDEIVFQTRLLSFNASVEAERAGEHGRGFSVVAQEVGNLAQMSGKSASEISRIVRDSIREAQEVVEQSQDRLSLGVKLCRETLDHLNQISSVTVDIRSGAQSILKGADEQSIGIQQINQSIQIISKATQENSIMANRVSINSQKVEESGSSLKLAIIELNSLVGGKPQNRLAPLSSFRGSKPNASAARFAAEAPSKKETSVVALKGKKETTVGTGDNQVPSYQRFVG